jgi:hypothetical protein
MKKKTLRSIKIKKKNWIQNKIQIERYNWIFKGLAQISKSMREKRKEREKTS